MALRDNNVTSTGLTPELLYEKDKIFHDETIYNLPTSTTPVTKSATRPVVSPNLQSTDETDFDKSTRAGLSRKARKLLLMANGISRREAKNQATLETVRKIEALGDKASEEQKRWAAARRKLYTLGSDGTLTRNKTNFWHYFAPILGGLALGPTGAVMGAMVAPGKNRYSVLPSWGGVPLTKTEVPSNETSATTPDKPKENTVVKTGQDSLVPNSILTTLTPPVVPKWNETRWGMIASKYGLNSEEAVKARQRFLQREGLYSGPIDGKWGHASRVAHEDYRKKIDNANLSKLNTNFDPNFSSNLSLIRLGFYHTPDSINQITNTNRSNNAQIKNNKTTWKTVTNINSLFTNILDNNKNVKAVRTPEGYLLYDNGRAKITINGKPTMVNYKYEGYDILYLDPVTKLWNNAANIKKHKQGGTMTKQQDSQEELLTYATLGLIGYANANLKPIDFTTAINQVMKLAQTKPEALQDIASNEELVKSGVQILQLQEPEVLDMISKPGGLTKVLSQMQSQAVQAAKHGAKLQYIQRLKGVCPEGYEMTYMKAGGKVCPVCKKKAKKAQEGTVINDKIQSKRVGGSISEVMNLIKMDLFKQGGNVKKAEVGTQIDNNKSINKSKPKNKIIYTEKDNNDGSATFEFKDSTELNDYKKLSKMFRTNKNKMTKQQWDRLLELNTRIKGSDYD